MLWCCFNSGLKVVETLSKSSGYAQSVAASAALRRMLDSNLSAKYWVTGRLEPSDVMKDIEFFDAGVVNLLVSCVLFCIVIIVINRLRAAAITSHPSLSWSQNH